jgi:4-hydroxybenzoate polyprenyltransferase
MSEKEKEPTVVLPQYVPPTTGLLSLVPPSWVPYGQLMRLDKPGGFYAFYFPYVTGLSYAACISESSGLVINPLTILHRATIFFVGSIFLRGAACTWNDNIDQEYDRKVARCRLRPIARGAVSTIEGHLFTVIQTLIGSLLFTQLPTECIYDTVPITILFAIYPFGKRFTDYPQLILGFPFAGAIIMSCHSLAIDPWTPQAVASTTSLVMANVLWTMVYDTIYAHQDKKDDEKAGVKSMAVRFKDSTKTISSILGVAVISLLVTTGVLLNLSWIYFLLTCGGTSASLTAMISLVNLDTPSNCMWWFTWGFWMVGASLVTGFFGEYIKNMA